MKYIIDISEYNKEWINNAYSIPDEINTAIAESIIYAEQIIYCKYCQYYGTNECFGRNALYGLHDYDFCSRPERSQNNE